MDTVIIDVSTRFTDQTGPGLDKTRQKTDKATESLKKSQEALDKFGRTKAAATVSVTDKATEVINKITSGAKQLAGKTFSMTMKVVDFATAPLRGMLNFATSLKGIITGIVAGFAAQKAIMDPINLADMFTTAQVGFETKLGSVAKAQKMMQDIQNFAIRTPFETQDVVNTSQQMLAMGWQAQRILPDLEKIGNTAAATGKGAEGIQRITLALNQMRMKGKVSADEMLQLTEAGVSGWQYLAKGLGVSTAEVQKMTQKGLVPADKAIDLIIKGMGEFDGMMDKTANRTVSGLISQLKDLFTISVVKKWGEGLQAGALRGLSTLNDLLSKNRSEFDKFGDQMKTWGTQFSNWVVDSAEKEIQTISKMMNDPAFQKADFWGKTQIAWDTLVADPFSKWWDGSGGQKVRDIAGKAGEALGESIAKGIATAFGKLLPSVAGDAFTLLPGGASPSGTSWLSAAAMLWGGSKVAGAAGSAINWGKGLFGSGASAGAAGAAGAASSVAEESPLWLAAHGVSPISAAPAASAGAGISGASIASGFGIAAAAAGLAAAGSDLVYSFTQERQKDKQDAYYKAGTRTGLVGAGALIGTLILPGAGTMIGAGVGGLAALLAGGNLGKLFSDMSDGTHQIDQMSDSLKSATDNATKLSEKDKATKSLVEQYQWAERVLNDGNSTVKDRAAAQIDLKDAVKKLADIYPDLISQYDIENGKLGDKLSTIKQISSLEKEQSKIQLEQTAEQGKGQLASIEEKYKKNADELKGLQDSEKKYNEGIEKMYSYRAEVEKLTAQESVLSSKGDTAGASKVYDQIQDYKEKISEVTKSLNGNTYDNVDPKHFFDNGAFDTYLNKQKDIQNSELASLKDNTDLQNKYDAVYEAEKQLIELDLGGTIEEQATKFDKLGKTAQNAFLDALQQIDALQKSMDMLPKDKQIDIDLITRQTILAGMDKKAYDEVTRQKKNEERGTGYAGGTTSAQPGLYQVGEHGPELVDFKGGESVYTASESRKIISGGSSSGAVHVTLGGNGPLINIQVDGSKDTNGVITAIRAKMPQIANELADYLAQAMAHIDGNTPITEG